VSDQHAAWRGGGELARWSPKVSLAVKCVPGVVLQLGGLWWILRPGWAEVNLAIGVVLMVVGTPSTMFALERYVARIGRRDRWALLGLLGPLGPIGAAMLRPGEPSASDGTDPIPPLEDRVAPRSSADRVAGLFLTVLIAVGLCLATAKLLAGTRARLPLDRASLERNELLAYQRLRSIAAAQTRYAERDWDGDGHKSYAEHSVHLWQSVDAEGKPIPVGLIPRELGFAMVPKLALDGYVFRSLHWRAGLATEPGPVAADRIDERQPIDPEQSWAVAAEPAEPGKGGRLVLLADGSSGIWILRSGGSGIKGLPSRPEAQGWARVQSASELAAIQAKMPPATATSANR